MKVDFEMIFLIIVVIVSYFVFDAMRKNDKTIEENNKNTTKEIIQEVRIPPTNSLTKPIKD